MGSRFYVPQLDWGTMPIEMLCVIFQNLDGKALGQCMFVSHRWNDVAQYIAERKDCWEEIATNSLIDSGASSCLKSTKLTWRDCFINQLLWSHTAKAKVSVKHVYSVPMIKNIHVFKDNLIVVHCDGINYFHIGTSSLLRKILTKCQDYEETNELLLKVVKINSFRTLYLYGKHEINDFDINWSNVMKIDKVMHYRLVKNCCYVLDSRNTLCRYEFSDFNWTIKHMGRYYGGDSATVDLNVFTDDVLKDEVFMMLKWGDVLWANAHCGFEKTLDVKIPSTDTTSSVYIKMFHRFGVVFGVPKTKPFSFNRYDINREKTFLFECPGLTCVTEHGEILIVGHIDGTIKIFAPRVLNEENVLRFERQLKEVPEIKHELIVAIDVFEEKGRNHLFIATHSHIAHFIFEHNNIDDYIWNEYPFQAPLKADERVDSA